LCDFRGKSILDRSLINLFQLNAYQKASIVEVGNKHGNGDEFLDFVDLLFFLAYPMTAVSVN
jgi:hypothetical protein